MKRLLPVFISTLLGLVLTQPVLAYEEADVQELLMASSCQRCDLSFADLTKADLAFSNLTAANLRGATLRETNFDGANLSNTDLRWADFSGAVLSRADLRGADLSVADLEGSNLRGANLSGANLNRVDLGGMNLSGINFTGATLTGSILSNTNLRDADMSGADLTGSTLRGSDLRNAKLGGANLRGVNLTEVNLTGANFDLEGYRPIEKSIVVKKISSCAGITSFALEGDSHYMTSKTGRLYVGGIGEFTDYEEYVRSYPDLLAAYNKGKDQTIEDFGKWHWQTHGHLEHRRLPDCEVGLNLTSDSSFIDGDEAGLLSVVTKDNSIYISYTTQEDPSTEELFLVIDEYSRELSKIRTVKKIPLTAATHLAGTLLFDKFGKLYISVGDGGGNDPNEQAQDLHSLKGKIFRMDVSKADPELEVVAYGLRNPWKYYIDGQDRMFIGDVGGLLESVYVLDKLYPTSSANLGWPIFVGTKKRKDRPLQLEEIVSPIYEYRHHSEFGRAVIGGIFLEDMGVYLFGDFLGNLRLLKERQNGKWDEVHYQKIANSIYSFGYDRKNNKIYTSDSKGVYELEISMAAITSIPRVVLCRTIMSDGTINNSSC